jgi:hypothetical protein
MWKEYKALVSHFEQGRIKGRVSRAADRGAKLKGAQKHHWNKSEIWCQLTQVSTRDSLHIWQNVNLSRSRRSSSPSSGNKETLRAGADLSLLSTFATRMCNYRPRHRPPSWQSPFRRGMYVPWFVLLYLFAFFVGMFLPRCGVLRVVQLHN